VAGALQIRRAVWDELCEHAKTDARLECCGLLAGRDSVITHVSAAENVAADPAKGYEIAPKEVVGLMREFRAAGLEFLGIYHSHPKTDNAPSPRDIELAYYSEEAYFIISPLADAPRPVRAFSIRDGCVTELEIQVVT
jgi:proteasome lid subunit RPN8/RPN11